MPDNARKLLVTGASGHLGRRAVEILLESKAGHVIAASRNPEKIKDLGAKGAELRKLDFEDASTFAAAYAGVERVLLISTDSLDRPGHRLEQHLRGLDGAVKAGVKHVSYTSLTHPEPDSLVSLAPDHWGTEQALAKSGLAYTVLRNNLYTDFLIDKLKHALAAGQLVSAAGQGLAAYVTREDCAAAAAAALAGTGSDKQVLDISGPALIGQTDLAKILSKHSGTEIPYAPVPAAGLRSGLEGAGLPPMVVDMLVSFDQAIEKGQMAVLSDAFQKLCGRPPQAVEVFLKQNPLIQEPA